MVTCTELHKQITAFVDDRIDEAAYRERIEKHIERCAECRQAYESELVTKMAVRGRGGPARSVESLQASPAEATARDGSAQQRRTDASNAPHAQPPGWFERFGRDWVSLPGVIAAALLVVAALWYLGYLGSDSSVVLPGGATSEVGEGTAGRAPAPRNFLNQASRNLDAIVDGTLSVTHETKQADDLLEFFQSKGVPYRSALRAVKLPLRGGLVSKHGANDDLKLAHWVYEEGDDMVYFFEVPEALLRNGSIFYLTNDALDRLRGGEELWEEFSARSTVCAFAQGDRVYAVASTMDKNDLRRAVPGL